MSSIKCRSSASVPQLALLRIAPQEYKFYLIGKMKGLEMRLAAPSPYSSKRYLMIASLSSMDLQCNTVRSRYKKPLYKLSLDIIDQGLGPKRLLCMQMKPFISESAI